MFKEEDLQKIYDKTEEVTGSVLSNRNRKRSNVYAKKIYCHIARQKGHTLQSIGGLAGLNHATVLYHCADTPYLLKQDEDFFKNYLKVQGRPTGENKTRDFFDLSIAKFLKK